MKTLNIDKAILRLNQNAAICHEQIKERKLADDHESVARIEAVADSIQLVRMMLEDCAEESEGA